LRDGRLAEDVVQETLIRAWQDLRALRDVDRFDAWLQRILVRNCYRAAARHRRLATFEVDMGNEAGPAASDTEQAVDMRDQLARGFRRLTPDQRAVVVLHHYLGFSLAEAAAILGIPLGTMQSRLFRALHAMRAAIEADERPAMLEGGPG
jgi:RNA polymerase sigma-70 factor, ECF subfamily